MDWWWGLGVVWGVGHWWWWSVVHDRLAVSQGVQCVRRLRWGCVVMGGEGSRCTREACVWASQGAMVGEWVWVNGCRLCNAKQPNQTSVGKMNDSAA